MADTYVQSSTEFTLSDPDGARTILQKLYDIQKRYDDGLLEKDNAILSADEKEFLEYCKDSTSDISSLTIAGNILFVCVELNADYDVLGYALNRILQSEPNETTWVVPYAVTCSRMIVDAFGGGVLVVTVNGWGVWGAADLARSIMDERGDYLIENFIPRKK